jgi:hypothetical protein
MAVLRELLERECGSTWRLGDHEVIERFAGQVARGRYCLIESSPDRVVTAARGGPSRSGGALRAVRSVPVAVAMQPPDAGRAFDSVVATTYWIEIELIGADDRPVGDVAYTLRTPAGHLILGRLDTTGYARVDGLQSPGMCAVSFPELDQDAWEFVHALSARA